MALIDEIQTTDATVPTALKSQKNGQLPDDWLRSFDGTTRADFKMFVPVSYAMQALHIAARGVHIRVMTTGRYRTYARQEALFRERYKTGSTNNDNCGTKTWQGQTWYLQRSDKGSCFAMAAVPGTSNHGLGIADDFAENLDEDATAESLSLNMLRWLKDNARSFGFALDIRSEPWHWHWYQPSNPNTLSQRVVDTLKGAGVAIPDLSRFGFTVPGGSTTPVQPPAGTPRVAKSGGTATAGWTGWYSVDDAKSRIALTSWPDAQHMTLTLHAVDAKTLRPPADPAGWTDVYWAANDTELTSLLGPVQGSTPPPPPPPPPSGETFNYTVQAGDTLWELAQEFDTSVAAIKTANGLTSDTIHVGQVLKIPGKTHTVVAGDTLWELAETYDTTVAAIKELNGLTSDTIQIGQVLRIPT